MSLHKYRCNNKFKNVIVCLCVRYEYFPFSSSKPLVVIWCLTHSIALLLDKSSYKCLESIKDMIVKVFLLDYFLIFHLWCYIVSLKYAI